MKGHNFEQNEAENVAKRSPIPNDKMKAGVEDKRLAGYYCDPSCGDQREIHKPCRTYERFEDGA